MNDKNVPGGFFGFLDEWSPRVNPPHPEYLISFNNGDVLIEYWTPRVEDTQEPHDREMKCTSSLLAIQIFPWAMISAP
jgi:hypothetical protein